MSEPGFGNFVVLPGSHRRNTIERPPDDDNDLPGAVPDPRATGRRGAVRPSVAHAEPEPLRPDAQALFFAYTYRWIRQRDELRVRPELLDLVTPARAQLLGAGADATHFWMADHVDLPLSRGQDHFVDGER